MKDGAVRLAGAGADVAAGLDENRAQLEMAQRPGDGSPHHAGTDDCHLEGWVVGCGGRDHVDTVYLDPRNSERFCGFTSSRPEICYKERLDHLHSIGAMVAKRGHLSDLAPELR